jgi:hypothetical protein
MSKTILLLKNMTKRKPLQPMLLKCYHHLHHVVDCDVEFTKHKSNENNNLDVFEMITNSSEPITKLINKELVIFKRFQVNIKEIKCPL